jgi:hypothetical protein
MTRDIAKMRGLNGRDGIGGGEILMCHSSMGVDAADYRFAAALELALKVNIARIRPQAQCPVGTTHASGRQHTVVRIASHGKREF